MYSIYHFFKKLVFFKKSFATIDKLENFSYPKNLMSCVNVGIFPDMAIRVNRDKSIFTGGELIELKDSKTYTISSFNSTIPTGKKEISKVIISDNSNIKSQMLKAGNSIYSVPIRDVFYLVRGRKKFTFKVCLIHGSFFETIKVDELIRESFSQILEERLNESGEKISDGLKSQLLNIFSQQENFSKVRNVNKASVTLRFRIMTEVKKEGNILNSKKYPQIKDNTINFILPCSNDNEEAKILQKMDLVFGKKYINIFDIFKIKHILNGFFICFQISL